MDTKLKKFNDNMAVRTLAFILCVIFLVGTLVGLQATMIAFHQANRSFSLNELVQENGYLYSEDLQSKFEGQVESLIELICYYKSEENIKAENLLNEEVGELASAINSLFYNHAYETEAEIIVTDQMYNEAESSGYYNLNIDINNSADRQAFILANKDQIDIIKNHLIKEQLRSYNKLKENMESLEGFTYYVTDGSNVVTNMQLKDGEIPKTTSFEKNPAYLIYEDGKLTKVPDSQETSVSYMDRHLEDRLFGQYNDGLRVYFSFDDQYIGTAEKAYQSVSGVMNWLPWLAACAFACLIVFIYLVVTTGRKDEEGNRRIYQLDRLWTEVQLGLVLLTGGCGVALVAEAMYTYDSYRYTSYQVGSVLVEQYAQVALSNPELIAIAALATLLSILGLWFLLACIRLLKAKCFIKNTLIYKLWKPFIYTFCCKLGSRLIEIFNGSSLMKKVVIIAIIGCLLSATVFLAPIVLLIIIVFAPKWVKKFEDLQVGVDEVKNGNLAYKIETNGVSELDQLAQGINEISEASNIAIQNELKNQRLKTELISNVSHDLKTPLTSMVTYIDLLKNEGLHSENAPDYLRVLDEKTNRLRQLTEDLFEAAKASSGAMPVRLEKVELLSLIHQGLGEMDQRIKASGLDFIIKTEKEKYHVMADGQLLWRVVENLLGNVIKYAAENSRVYIDIKEMETLVTLEMKNISKQPLNISSDELMERFKRGDESRTTEGSGLGLAIAKDLVKLQQGWFEIIIDGDLFKARVMLNKPQ